MARLGFGKYSDYELSDVPEEYLEWLIRSSKERIEQCETELHRREIAAEASMSWMEKMLKIGFRELSKRHHPDVGGTVHEMQEINASYDALKKAMRGS